MLECDCSISYYINRVHLSIVHLAMQGCVGLTCRVGYPANTRRCYVPRKNSGIELEFVSNNYYFNECFSPTHHVSQWEHCFIHIVCISGQEHRYHRSNKKNRPCNTRRYDCHACFEREGGKEMFYVSLGQPRWSQKSTYFLKQKREGGSQDNESGASRTGVPNNPFNAVTSMPLPGCVLFLSIVQRVIQI